jgi:hypothetical protein
MPKKTTINQEKYDKKNIKQYTLKLHKENDKDIIDAIDVTVPENKQGSIKELIRRGIYGE